MKQIKLSPLAEEILAKRYLPRNYRGELLETPESMFRRVARAVAEADRLFDSTAAVRATADIFEDAMVSLSFLPNSPCLMHAGRPMGQLSACFVLPVEDSLESIFQTLKDTALIHQTGGGTGFSFSRLRPRGDTILPAFGIAGGPVSFLHLFDTATHIIDRNQIRPSANMGVLNASHPDIEEFIRSKQTGNGLVNFNISVAVDDVFINQAKQEGVYALIHPRTGKNVGGKSAAEILHMIAECAWETGDPGIIFIDRINRDNPTPGMGRLETTNPCGEQPLLPHESCTLGSINLTKIIKNRKVDYNKLTDLVHTAVHFLDNVIEISRYPLRQVEEMSRANRKIGLGVMGFADMLILSNIPYQSDEALKLAEDIMAHIREQAELMSSQLAEKRGNFPSFDHSVFPARGIKHRRNATLTTIAPTGTISLIAGVSSGIEPVFAFEAKRRVIDKVVTYVHPVYAQMKKENTNVSPDVFQTAWDIPPEQHLKIQEAFQKHTDNAVSKTVNMPTSATVEDIKQLYSMALDMNIKGITVYRDQSKPGQILMAESPKCKECG